MCKFYHIYLIIFSFLNTFSIFSPFGKDITSSGSNVLSIIRTNTYTTAATPISSIVPILPIELRSKTTVENPQAKAEISGFKIVFQTFGFTLVATIRVMKCAINTYAKHANVPKAAPLILMLGTHT